MCFGSKSTHQPYSTRPNVRYNSKPMTTADYQNYKPMPLKYSQKSKNHKAGYHGGHSSGGGFWGGFGGSGDGGGGGCGGGGDGGGGGGGGGGC